MSKHVPLARRVEHAYLGDRRDGAIPALAGLGRIYPGFGPGVGLSGLVDGHRPASRQDAFHDIGIGLYLETHPAVIEAAVTALRAGVNTRNLDLHDLKRAICRRYLDIDGIALETEEVMLLAAAKTGMALGMLAFLDPGDSIVIPDPDYIGLTHMAAALGGRIVRPPLLDAPAGRYAPLADRVVEAIRPGVKMVAFTNPNNPTGYVWTRADLEAIARAADAVGAVVLVNEVYDRMTFGDNRHTSYLAVSDRERSIVISSLTKTYNMMGFAMGWQVTSPRLVKRLGDLRFMTHYVPPSPSSQHAGLAALTPPLRDEIVSEVTRTFERGAQMTCAALADIEAVNCPMPQGGQFAFCHVGGDDLRFADWLKAEFGLAVVPGVIWGPSGRGFIRLALGNPPDYQERGLAMLREALLSGRSPAAGAGSAS